MVRVMECWSDGVLLLRQHSKTPSLHYSGVSFAAVPQPGRNFELALPRANSERLQRFLGLHNAGGLEHIDIERIAQELWHAKFEEFTAAIQIGRASCRERV